MAWLLFVASVDANFGSTEFFPVIESFRELGRELAYITFVLTVAAMVVGTADRRSGGRVPTGIAGYAAFLFLCAIKLAASGYVSAALAYLGAVALYAIGFGLFAVSPRQRMRLDLTTILAGCFGALVLCVVANLGAGLFAVHGFLGNERYSGLTVNPNMLAYTVAIFSLSVGEYLQPRKQSAVRVALGVAVLIGAAVLVRSTGSRGGMILFGAAVFVTIYLIAVPRWKPAILLILVLAIGAYLMAGLPIYGAEVFEGRENSRLHIWRQQLAAFSEHPLLGQSWKSQELHFGENSFLGALAELGILGGATVMMMLGGMLGAAYRTLKRSRSNQEERRAAVIALLMTGALAAAGLFEGILLGVVSPLIWLAMFIVVGATRTCRIQKRSRGGASDYLVAESRVGAVHE